MRLMFSFVSTPCRSSDLFRFGVAVPQFKFHFFPNKNIKNVKMSLIQVLNERQRKYLTPSQEKIFKNDYKKIFLKIPDFLFKK